VAASLMLLTRGTAGITKNPKPVPAEIEKSSTPVRFALKAAKGEGKRSLGERACASARRAPRFRVARLGLCAARLRFCAARLRFCAARLGSAPHVCAFASHV
jgi:hypothetical protein